MSRQSQQLDPMELEQKKLLNEALVEVERIALQMKIELDNNRLMSALTYCSNMVSELRTGLLSPNNYFDLYNQVSIHLNKLEEHIKKKTHGRTLGELYEFVQFAGNILPRLYLLIIIGSVYITTMDIPAKEVLRDLVEMCRGVQHPIRGIFLRNYLAEMTRDVLPDIGRKYLGVGGEVNDSIDFLIENFTEMNKLWVRMQHSYMSAYKSKLEEERIQLGTLVGKNLSLLGLLDGLTIGLYRSDVLPRIVTQIKLCNDPMAQQYLMEVIVQAFSDEFHLRTLQIILDSVIELNEQVNVQSIISSLITRLTRYCVANPSSIPEDVDLFKVFTEFVVRVKKERKESKLDATIKLLQSLLSMVLQCYKGNISHIDAVYSIGKDVIGSTSLKDTEIKELIELLKVPFKYFDDVTPILELQVYPEVLKLLPYENKKTISNEISHHALQHDTKIKTVNHVDILLKLLSPLYLGNPENPIVNEDEGLDGELSLLSSVISLLGSDDMQEMSNILNKAKEHFIGGGKERIKYTLIPLIFKALKVTQILYTSEQENWKNISKDVFIFAKETIVYIRESHPVMAFKLIIECSIAAGKSGFGKLAGHLITMAYEIFEDKFPKEKEKYDALNLIISALRSVETIPQEDYVKLVEKTLHHIKNLVNYELSCRLIAVCCNLYISKTANGPYENKEDLLKGLKLAVSNAGNYLDEFDKVVKEVVLIELLDSYVYFVKKILHNQTQLCSLLIEMIKKSFEVTKPNISVPRYLHFQNTIKYIKEEAKTNPVLAEIQC